MLDKNFHEQVEELKAARMGTELMGELIYSLIRSSRPQTLLEVGMGYTTPFMLQAIKDNLDDVQREATNIRKKNANYLKQIEGEDTAILKPGSKPLLLMDEWIIQEPALCSPEYYKSNYEPQLHAIDNFSATQSSASKVQQVIGELGLTKFITIHNTDFRGQVNNICKNKLLDFVWFDCGNANDYTNFLEEYWQHINPDGGILLLHSTLNRYSYNCILSHLKLQQFSSAGMNFELLSILEPHKLTQGSVTLIRKISSAIPKFLIEDAYELLDSIKAVI